MLNDVDDLKEIEGLNLYYKSTYKVIKWTNENNKKVFVSFTRKGASIVAHIAAERKSRKYLRKAVNEVCESFFMLYDWCNVIIGVIDQRSVSNLVYNCGFKLIKQTIIEGKLINIVGRYRSWVA